MAEYDDLLDEITHCSVVAQCKGGGDHPCASVVGVQQDVPLADHQVPEPWTGHLDKALILFVSSNPSIDPLEEYPSWSDGYEQTREYFVERFDGGPGQIKDGIYSPKVGGGWGGPVRFWSAARARARELVPAAVSGVDYALTEVVHCKSTNEIGVASARETCSQRYLPAIINQAGSAVVLAVFGTQAARAVADLFGVDLDGTNRYATIEIGGVVRHIVRLDHPSSGGKFKRFQTTLSPDQLEVVQSALRTESTKRNGEVEKSWTVPEDFQLRLADSPEIHEFLAMTNPNNGPVDPKMRVAEYFDVVRSLARNVGRTFASQSEATEALFLHLSGGGFGIHNALRRVVLHELDFPWNIT